MDIREDFIKNELKRRINALKTLDSTFEVDGIHFGSMPGADNMCMLGDIDKLAEICGCQVYETQIGERGAEHKHRAFEYDGVEVWTRIF